MRTQFYDDLETRTEKERKKAISKVLPVQIKNLQSLGGLKGIDSDMIDSVEALKQLPVLRKSELTEMQQKKPPFGGLVRGTIEHIFQSPGPIYEPGKDTHDWWRFGRFLHACGVGRSDIVQNCFSYHLTPAGMMFENGAKAVGATILPAGTGQTELQVQAAFDVGASVYAGTPDYLNTILEKSSEMGLKLSYSKAVVSGGALFPSLRESYLARGINCLQCYGTADLGCIAYESSEQDGMIVEEGVLLEIVTPGTGNPVKEGEVGEILVTTLNSDYPLVRFATGDMSAFIGGHSACGRTNVRIKGWMGRADQTTKVKGMFVRPEQVAELVNRHPEVSKARVVVSRVNESDSMVVRLEVSGSSNQEYHESVQNIFRIKGEVEVVPTDKLPKDGLVIEDLRSYD
ncbi:MAG: AMP-binding protein [Rhodobacteraceae bacterium]|nr:AMP-binding protein [Paracoccaceae bacterium]MBT6270701.1 AMP-binding protein [Paracoccaceae bacterium]